MDHVAVLVLSVALATGCAEPPASAPVITVPAPATATVAPSSLPAANTATAAPSASPAPTVAGALPPTHPRPECNAGERAFFACTTKDARKIAVCGADLGTPAASFAVVFGQAARAEGEIRLPVTADGTTLRYARYTRPRVTLLGVAFVRGSETYEVLAQDDESAQPSWSHALTVKTDGKPDRVLACAARSRVSLMGLEDHLAMQPPWF